MEIKKLIILFILLIQFFFANSSASFDHIDTWTSKLLYEYAKYSILSKYNPIYHFNLYHMILDPENYLRNADLSDIAQKMRTLYNKYNINTYIILISHLQMDENKPNFDINSEIKNFVSYFNYKLKRENYLYNDTMALTTVFFIKDRKMRMRTGSFLKNIIHDNDALDIINRRKNNLRNENYYSVVDELIDDIYQTYETNLVIYNSFFYKNKGKIYITLILFILGIIYLFSYLLYEPESVREKKIKDFLRQNRNRPIQQIFNDSCIICLDNFEEDKKNLTQNQEMPPKEEEKTSVLDCGHRFHEKCIVEWLKKHAKCPICRINVNFDGNQNSTQDQNSTVLNNNNFHFFIDIQTDYYPDEINEAQRRRIISDFDYTNRNSNSYSDNNNSSNDHDYSDFDSGSGGATSDW